MVTNQRAASRSAILSASMEEQAAPVWKERVSRIVGESGGPEVTTTLDPPFLVPSVADPSVYTVKSCNRRDVIA